MEDACDNPMSADARDLLIDVVHARSRWTTEAGTADARSPRAEAGTSVLARLLESRARRVAAGLLAVGAFAGLAAKARWHQGAELRADADDVGSLLSLSESAEEVAKMHIVGTVSWRAHPTKCWDYSHSFSPAPHAGMQMQIYDCKAGPDKFVIPVRGPGPIKIYGHEHLCLDAPGNAQLQFWPCDTPNQANINFLPSKLGKGIYRLKSRPSSCIDVPNRDDTNGNLVQVWDCNEGEEDIRFSIHAPVDCRWSAWTKWGECSEPCGSGKSLRRRAKSFGVTVRNSETGKSFFYPLTHLTRTQGGGLECPGGPSELRTCNEEPCPDEADLAELSDAPTPSPAPTTSRAPAGSTTDPLAPDGGSADTTDPLAPDGGSADGDPEWNWRNLGSEAGTRSGAARCRGAAGWAAQLLVLAAALLAVR